MFRIYPNSTIMPRKHRWVSRIVVVRWRI